MLAGRNEFRNLKQRFMEAAAKYSYQYAIDTAVHSACHFSTVFVRNNGWKIVVKWKNISKVPENLSSYCDVFLVRFQKTAFWNWITEKLLHHFIVNRSCRENFRISR